MSKDIRPTDPTSSITIDQQALPSDSEIAGVPPEFLAFSGMLSGLDYASVLISVQIELKRTDDFIQVAVLDLEFPADSILEYANVLARFLVFLKTGQRQSGCSESEFRSYRATVESLVQLGELRSRALRHWSVECQVEGMRVQKAQ